VKTIPSGLLSHLQNDTTSIATCWKVTLQGSPAQILGFTDHDNNLTVDGVTYLASTGFLPTAYETQTKMAVDNLQAQGFIDSELITEQDLLNGVWDFAEVEIFQVNFKSIGSGTDVLTKGHLGNISLERGKFEAELRGVANAFTQTRNKMYQPLCRVQFGSTECGVDVGYYTETGSITGVSADGLTMFDTARIEPGPSGKTITAISKATAGVVTSNAHGFVVGQYVFFYGIDGMTQLNGQYALITARTTNTFTINVNTTNYGTFTSGSPATATASTVGAGGYFAGGIITFNSGDNAGLSMEVKESAPGIIVLQLQFSRAVQVGDTYSVVAGCTKRFKEDCVGKYANGVNFRGHPTIPGLNKIIQSGGR
jgi:hypothetical protein